MWTIRQEQAEAFRQYHLQKFEDEMVEHLNDFAPKFCEVRGEPCIRRVIRIGIERAAKYGFTNRGPVRFYIELMISLGSDFDTDPQYPWATDALGDQEFGSQAVRADRLFDQLCQYMDHVAGPKFQHTLDALRRVQTVDFDSAQVPGHDLPSRMIARLRMIFPQKYTYVREPILRKLVGRGLEMGGAYGIMSERGLTAIVGLMFGVGHGAVGDPLYPWVIATLTDSKVKDPNVRAERLYRKAQIYCERMSASLEAEQQHV
jgi:hypothetical protein